MIAINNATPVTLQGKLIKTFKIIGINLLGLLAFLWCGKNFIYQNISISEPLGYYLALPGIPYHKGDLVLTCISDQSYKHVFTELGMKDVDGQCSNGMPYLIKRIVAVAGDKIGVTAAGIDINGILYSNSQQFIEGRGVKLYPLPLGYSHTLTDDEYFMLGQTPHSVDSRYFGVVKKTDIFRRAFLIHRT